MLLLHPRMFLTLTLILTLILTLTLTLIFDFDFDFGLLVGWRVVFADLTPFAL